MNTTSTSKIIKRNQITKCIYLSLIFGLTFLLEYINRETLIKKSINMSTSYSLFKSAHNDFLHKYIQIGDISYIKVGMSIIFLLFPINKSYTYLNAIAYSSFIANAFKLLYGPPMIDNLLTYFSNGAECPSTNLLLSTCSLLGLWKLVSNSDYIKNHQCSSVIKYTLLLIIAIFIYSLILVEVILQMHSLNKGIYGICFGFSIYYILFELFQLDEVSAKEFFRIFKNKRTTLLLKFSYCVEIILLFFLYYLLQKEFNFTEPLLLKTEAQTQFGDNALLNGLCIIMLLGACCGLEYLYAFSEGNFPGKYKEINNWNKVPKKLLVFIILLGVIYSFGMIVYSIVPLESPFEVIIILKTAFPYFIISYALFGPAIASCIVLSLANSLIYENKEGYGCVYREDGLEMRLTDNVIIV